jgi:hypothetical protein
MKHCIFIRLEQKNNLSIAQEFYKSVTAGQSSTLAMKESTEKAQFEDALAASK